MNLLKNKQNLYITMKQIYKKTFYLLVMLVIASLSQISAQPAYYHHHYVIVVDQGVIQRHSNTALLYRDLKELFIKNTPLGQHCVVGAIPQFDEKYDQISIFASGISHEDYIDLFWDCRNENYKKNEIVGEVCNKLFHSIGDFRSSGKSLAAYFDQSLKPLMNSEWKVNHLSDCHVGLNEYLYPLVLHKLDAKIPSENYYFIIISNFTAQGAIHTVFKQQVEPMLGRKEYIKEFTDDIERWKSYFYENDFAMGYTTRYAHDEGNTSIDINNNPKINYFKLGVKSLESVGISIKSSPQFSQQKLDGEEYKSTGADIVFNHPENLKITNIWATIQANDVNALVKYELGKDVNASKEGDLLVYQFENQKNINLGELRPSDKIETQYHFSALIEKTDGTPLLPMNFSTSCSYEMRETDFIPEPTSTATIIGIIVLVLLLFVVGYLLFRWSGYRGRKRKVKVDFRFLPVSNERYMDVSDMQVKEYDCWYMTTDVMNRTQTRIEIRGKMTPETLFFARSVYQYRLEFRVHDVDVDSNFTFRPQGQDQHGAEYELKKWYNAPCDANGNFSVSIIAYLDPDRHPNGRELTDDFWEQDHILKTQIDFRVLAVEKHNIELLNIPYFETNPFKEIPLANSQKVYEFIARPHFNLRDSWVAFDPGTSGACAAFITGGNIDNQDNIHLVKEQVEYSGDLVYESIFPSKIHVQDTARAFKQNSEEVQDVSQWEEGTDGASRKDFLFGWPAAQLISRNNFQSIKKLLGYTSLQLIVSGTTERQISGKKLAQLLVKGLYEHTKRYIMAMYRDERIIRQSTGANFVPQDIEDHYIENGEFNPKKAIVAVPNNYTLPKIQDMVDTVKALGQFREVHYLYESEGVLMQYFHKMWGELPQLCNRMFIVYDMGGATINATAFRISNSHMDSHQNLTDIEVETIGKIGYCVGGDDIDYAIMRQLFLLKDVKAAFGSEDAIKKNMAAHKQLLIKVARELKLELVAIYQGKSNRVQYLQSAESFTNSLQSYAKALGWPETLIVSEKEFQLWTNLDRLCGTSMFKRYIYAKVEDATNELFNSMSASYRNMPIELIFSGRSTLFPHIVTTVEDAMIGKLYNIWDGLMTDGYLDATLVKTAVAEGACWYAYFSRHIRIKHDIITSAFGYVDYDGGKELFVPLIQPGERFKNGRIEASCEPLSPALLREVQFMQMLGSNYDQILIDFRKSKGDNKHKLNIIDKIRLNSDVSRIAISIDERSNFEYAITAAGEVENISQDNYPQSRLRNGSTVRTEIADENNESYLFAAISSTEEIREEQMNIKLAPNSVKQQRKHI